MSEHWYVLRSKPNKEDSLFQLCRQRKYEVFYPRLRVNPVNPRSRSVRPFFPGYMFIHEDLTKDGRSTFKWLPFSYGLLTFGDEPGKVPDAIIQALKKRVEKVNDKGIDPVKGWRKGDELIIQDGPFEGLEAVFDARMSGHQRARILVKFLNDQWVKTEIDIRSLENMTRDQPAI